MDSPIIIQVPNLKSVSTTIYDLGTGWYDIALTRDGSKIFAVNNTTFISTYSIKSSDNAQYVARGQAGSSIELVYAGNGVFALSKISGPVELP